MASNITSDNASTNSPTGKQYGAYKVSEYTHGDSKRSYRVEEKDGVPAR